MTPIDLDRLWKAIEARNQQIALLCRIGEALYGDRWQTQLAKALGTSSRIVRRWVSCEAQIPWPLLDEILPSLFQAKADQLTRVCDELAEWRAVRAPKGRVPAGDVLAQVLGPLGQVIRT